MVKEHLEAFKEEQKAADKDGDFEFAVEFNRRNCTNLDRMSVINSIVELVGEDKTKVNLTTPRSVLMVEVFRNTCGFSVLTEFHRFKKYNVRSIIDPPVPGQQTAKKKEDKEEKKNAAKTDKGEEAEAEVEKEDKEEKKDAAKTDKEEAEADVKEDKKSEKEK
ncbi:hypothetical protein PHMEG_00027776, partial [Phytophthora megakarya]